MLSTIIDYIELHKRYEEENHPSYLRERLEKLEEQFKEEQIQMMVEAIKRSK